jgi:hypothetical protein
MTDAGADAWGGSAGRSRWLAPRSQACGRESAHGLGARVWTRFLVAHARDRVPCGAAPGSIRLWLAGRVDGSTDPYHPR